MQEPFHLYPNTYVQFLIQFIVSWSLWNLFKDHISEMNVELQNRVTKMFMKVIGWQQTLA